MIYTLRPATKDDYDFLYALHVATMKKYVTAVWGWNESAQRQLFRARLDPEHTQIVVVDGVDAGVLKLDRGDTEYFVNNIGLMPEYQNRGIGTAILTDILREAREKGLPVALGVLRGNPARRLYERLGFVVTQETEQRIYMRAQP
jgi:ribosomal protein S18 acetylase RimI-like enzyme